MGARHVDAAEVRYGVRSRTQISVAWLRHESTSENREPPKKVCCKAGTGRRTARLLLRKHL